MAPQRSLVDPFDLRSGRAMVSLGPLSPKKYCTFSCPFCYVQSDFLSYASLSISEIVRWLRTQRNQFDIVYVSGDTDSFAPPRTDQGIDLLWAITQFDVDILFTTRALLSSQQLSELER